jgi:hypothetical protein
MFTHDWYGHPAVTTVVRSRSTSIGDVLETARRPAAARGLLRIQGTGRPVAPGAADGLDAFAARPRAAGKDQQEPVLQAVHTLYTALLFAAPLLETFAAGVDRPDPHLALLARFAAEQARWALRQCSGHTLGSGGGER